MEQFGCKPLDLAIHYQLGNVVGRRRPSGDLGQVGQIGRLLVRESQGVANRRVFPARAPPSAFSGKIDNLRHFLSNLNWTKNLVGANRICA
jgi:hypothetical protein